jgi:acylpyruvate hydrolase
MRLVTFVRDGTRRLGALIGGADAPTLLDLNRADDHLPPDMLAFLAGGDEAQALARAALDDRPAAAQVSLAAVRLAAPVPAPGKIIGVGRNYADHSAELGGDLPKYPLIFAKWANTVIGPGEAIVLPKISEQIDYEGELAVVIGRRAHDVREAEALHYVAGYTAFNDVTARDIQYRTTQYTLGKTLDTFGPMGPAVVTTDEITDPQNLGIRLSIGGETLQSGHTGRMIFSVAYLVSYLSAIMTLEPGDVIATGTPAGVGYGRKPQRWLRAGDIVRVEVDGVGVLENPVVRPA